MINKKNHFYGIINNLVNLIAPMTVLPFVINQVGIEKYGSFVQENIIYALTTAVLFTSLTGYFIKEFVQNEKHINTIFGVQLIFALVSGFIFFIYLLFTDSHSGALYFLIAILSNALNFEWFFHARGMQKELFYRTITIRSLFIISVVVVLPFTNNIQTYVLIYALAVASSNLLTFLIVINKLKWKTLFFNNSIAEQMVRIKRMIWDAKYFMLTPTVGSVYQYGDQLLVSVLFGNSQLVFINLAKQLIGASVMVSGTLCRVEQKNIISLVGAERITRIKRIFSYYCFYLLASFIAINLLLPSILNLLVKESQNVGVWYYMLIAAVFVITSISIFIDYVIGVSYRRELFTLKSNVICAIVVTGLNALFLKNLGAYFSLVSLTIGEVIVVALLIFFHRKTLVSEKIN